MTDDETAKLRDWLNTHCFYCLSEFVAPVLPVGDFTEHVCNECAQETADRVALESTKLED